MSEDKEQDQYPHLKRPLDAVRVLVIYNPSAGIMLMGSPEGDRVCIGATDAKFDCICSGLRQARHYDSGAVLGTVTPLEFLDIVLRRSEADVVVLNDRVFFASSEAYHRENPPRDGESRRNSMEVKWQAAYEILGWLVVSSQTNTPWGEYQDRLDKGESVRLTDTPPRTERFLAKIDVPEGDFGLDHVAPLLVTDDTGTVQWLFVEPDIVREILQQLRGHDTALFWAWESEDGKTIHVDSSTVVSFGDWGEA